MRCVAPFYGCALVAFILGACSTAPKLQPRTSEVRVQWHGHNCFSLRSSIGLTVVTDPFHPSIVSYPRPKNLNADLVLMSGEDPNASHAEIVANAAPMLRGMGGAGRTTVSGIPVNGVEMSGRRVNTVYCFRLDGVYFAHLGSLERPLSNAEAQRLGPVDVLFLPVGGPKNLSVSELDKTAARLSPRIIVPMGYRTRRSASLDLRPLNDWLSRQKRVTKLPGSHFVISRAALPMHPTVIVLAVP